MALDATEVGVLFDQAGKAMQVGVLTEAATQTGGTIAAAVENLVQAIAVTQPVEIHDAVAGAPKSTPSLVSAGQGNNTATVQAPVQNLVIQTVKADSQQPDDGATTAVTELIRQMAQVPTPQTLNANEPTVSTVTYGDSFTGVHDGGDNQATVMTDSTATFVVDALIGRTVRNTTDGSEGVITDNDATTITVAALAGGTGDDWDDGDVYVVDGTTTASSNNGDGAFNASTKRGDGLVNEHILGEDIEGTITSALANGQASLQLKGELSVSLMSPDWPAGSGITNTLTSFVGATGGNLVNGSFETADTNEADLADGWISVVASSTLGTTLDLTPVEVQTVEITDISITGGYYTITHTDKDSDTQTTIPLVYNATSSAVQTALRNLNGLGSVTVTQSGTSPNLTHTVTFTDVTNPGELTVDTTNVTGGTPGSSVTTTTAGSASVMRGARAVKFTGNAGAELTSIAHPVSLLPATVYALSVWLKNDGALAAGEMNIGLFDSVASGASAITNDQAVAQEFAAVIDLTNPATTATFTQKTAFFQTPTIMPPSLFLRVRMTTAITNGEEVHMDELVLVPATELYAGGPFAALFTGPTDWVVGDEVKFSPVNAQAGLIHTWMNRVFNLSSNRLLFPSLTDTNETIADSKIS